MLIFLFYYYYYFINIGDTYLHSWEILAKIMKSDEAQNILVDIGM